MFSFSNDQSLSNPSYFAQQNVKVSKAFVEINKTINTIDALFSQEQDIRTSYQDLASIGNATVEPHFSKDKTLEYDAAIFGPKLLSESIKEQGMELKNILLAKESDFVDALLNIDRNNFMSNPRDAILSDCGTIRSVVAGIYSANRDHYLAMPIESAMTNVFFYRFTIRHLRSLLHLSDLIIENIELISHRSQALDNIKEKYEEIIYVLKRQLEDYQKTYGGIKKNRKGEIINGTMQDDSKVSSKLIFVVVQIENFSELKQHRKRTADCMMNITRTIILNSAQSYDSTRVNFDPNSDSKDSVTCFMFVFQEIYDAIAFGIDVHSQLQNADWPRATTQSSDYAKINANEKNIEVLWKGLTVRVGINYGETQFMKCPPENTKVPHYDGKSIEKCIILGNMGVSGDTIVSQEAWEVYQQSIKDTNLPPSKRYNSLKNLASQQIIPERSPGLKSNEFIVKIWAAPLEKRKSILNPRSSFNEIFFPGVEPTAIENDSFTLFTEKENEISMLRQELDGLKINNMKLSFDLEKTKNSSSKAITEIKKKNLSKKIYFDSLHAALENELMKDQDIFSNLNGKIGDTQKKSHCAAPLLKENKSPEKRSRSTLSLPIASNNNSKQISHIAPDNSVVDDKKGALEQTSAKEIDTNISENASNRDNYHEIHGSMDSPENSQFDSNTTINKDQEKEQKSASKNDSLGKKSCLNHEAKDTLRYKEEVPISLAYNVIQEFNNLLTNFADSKEKKNKVSEKDFFSFFSCLMPKEKHVNQDNFIPVLKNFVKKPKSITSNNDEFNSNILGHLANFFLLICDLKKNKILNETEEEKESIDTSLNHDSTKGETKNSKSNIKDNIKIKIKEFDAKKQDAENCIFEPNPSSSDNFTNNESGINNVSDIDEDKRSECSVDFIKKNKIDVNNKFTNKKPKKNSDHANSEFLTSNKINSYSQTDDRFIPFRMLNSSNEPCFTLPMISIDDSGQLLLKLTQDNEQDSLSFSNHINPEDSFSRESGLIRPDTYGKIIGVINKERFFPYSISTHSGAYTESGNSDLQNEIKKTEGKHKINSLLIENLDQKIAISDDSNHTIDNSSKKTVRNMNDNSQYLLCLTLEGAYLKAVEFQPQIVKLIKNDFHGLEKNSIQLYDNSKEKARKIGGNQSNQEIKNMRNQVKNSKYSINSKEDTSYLNSQELQNDIYKDKDSIINDASDSIHNKESRHIYEHKLLPPIDPAAHKEILESNSSFGNSPWSRDNQNDLSFPNNFENSKNNVIRSLEFQKNVKISPKQNKNVFKATGSFKENAHHNQSWILLNQSCRRQISPEQLGTILKVSPISPLSRQSSQIKLSGNVETNSSSPEIFRNNLKRNMNFPSIKDEASLDNSDEKKINLGTVGRGLQQLKILKK